MRFSFVVVIGPFKIDNLSISFRIYISFCDTIILSFVILRKTNNENWKISVLFIELLSNWRMIRNRSDHFWPFLQGGEFSLC